MAARKARGLLRRSLRSLLAPAENPATAQGDPVDRQWRLREQVRAASVEVQAALDRAGTERAAVAAQIAELEASARAAVAAGQEETARVALRRQQLAIATERQLDRQLAAMSAELQRLGLLDHQIGTQLDEVAHRERLASVRHSTARVQVDVGEALTGIEPLSEPDAVAWLERDAETLEARAAAIAELRASGVLPGVRWPMPDGSDAEEEIERRVAELRAETQGGQVARPRNE